LTCVGVKQPMASGRRSPFEGEESAGSCASACRKRTRLEIQIAVARNPTPCRGIFISFLNFLLLPDFPCAHAFDFRAYSVPARIGTSRYPLNGSRPEVFPDGESALFAWRRPSHLLPAPRGSLCCEELGCAIAAAGRGSLGSTRERSEPEQFPQALGLSAANRNLGLLLVVHSQLIGTLEPRNDFANAVDIHQVGTVGSPEKIRV